MSTPAPVHPNADVNFAPAPIIVNANTATPEAVAAGVTANQQQMQKVNDLSRGGSARSRSSKKVKPHSRRRHIRTYRRRGRGHQHHKQQNGGAEAAVITIPQAPGQATCSEGPQCAGAQNANLTSVLNQAKSSGANDAYVSGGGKKRMRKTRNSQKRRRSQHRQ